jgi:hypothetical protein
MPLQLPEGSSLVSSERVRPECLRWSKSSGRPGWRAVWRKREERWKWRAEVR